MIPMRRLFTFMQRSLRSSRPVGREGFTVKEPAKEDTKDLQGYHCPCLKLSNELLLMIASFLDKEFQVLLSLSLADDSVPFSMAVSIYRYATSV